MTPSIQTPSESPRIEQLRCEIAEGHAGALDRFWAEIEERGAPIVEPIPGSEGLVRVTFVWRQFEPVENVALIENFSVVDPRGTPLERIGDTDVWARSFIMHHDLRFTYSLSINDSLISVYEDPDPGLRFARFQRDPLNPHTGDLPCLSALGLAPTPHADSYVELPAAAPAPWLHYRPEIGHGELETITWASDTLSTTRQVHIYTPPGYPASNEPCSLLLLFDGERAVDLLGATVTLDNLIGERRIPPTICAMITSQDRSIEYPCNGAFAGALCTELLPALRRDYRIAAGPERVIAGGVSYGGLASAWLALTRPESVGNALSLSGSFQWRQGTGRIARDRTTTIGDAPAYGWLAAQVAEWERRPVRFFIAAGRLEALNAGVEPSLLAATRHFRDVLTAKGYRFDYQEFGGGHDYVNWRISLADGLLALNPLA